MTNLEPLSYVEVFRRWPSALRDLLDGLDPCEPVGHFFVSDHGDLWRKHPRDFEVSLRWDGQVWVGSTPRPSRQLRECPYCMQSRAETLPAEIGGPIRDCVRCEYCPGTYVQMQNGRWFSADD